MNPAILSGRPLLPWGTPGAINIVVDGNSIMAGGQDNAVVGGPVGLLKQGTAPFSSQLFRTVAIGGQTTTDMTNNASDVDGAWTAGKINILVVQEGTNTNGRQADGVTNNLTLGTGISGAANCDRFMSYLAARRSARQWDAIVVATPPPGTYVNYFESVSPGNGAALAADWGQRLSDYCAALRSRYREQADALVDGRAPGGPWAPARFPDTAQATFDSTATINSLRNTDLLIREGNGDRVHPTLAGQVAWAPYFAAALLRLRKRRAGS